MTAHLPVTAGHPAHLRVFKPLVFRVVGSAPILDADEEIPLVSGWHAYRFLATSPIPILFL